MLLKQPGVQNALAVVNESGSQRFFHHGTLKGCLSLGISRTESPDAVMPEDGQVVFFLPGKEGIRNSP